MSALSYSQQFLGNKEAVFWSFVISSIFLFCMPAKQRRLHALVSCTMPRSVGRESTATASRNAAICPHNLAIGVCHLPLFFPTMGHNEVACKISQDIISSTDLIFFLNFFGWSSTGGWLSERPIHPWVTIPGHETFTSETGMKIHWNAPKNNGRDVTSVSLSLTTELGSLVNSLHSNGETCCLTMACCRSVFHSRQSAAYEYSLIFIEIACQWSDKHDRY